MAYDLTIPVCSHWMSLSFVSQQRQATSYFNKNYCDKGLYGKTSFTEQILLDKGKRMVHHIATLMFSIDKNRLLGRLLPEVRKGFETTTCKKDFELEVICL